jgi:hypothetical protein
VDRWKEFREIRKQLRCCNWIQLPNGQSPDIPVVKAGRRMVVDRHFLPETAASQESEHFRDPLSFVPSVRAAISLWARAVASKLLRKKRRMRDQIAFTAPPESWPLAVTRWRQFAKRLVSLNPTETK